ncbi:MAG: HEAT repeat domain-containing protein [Pirellulaceae bacterium]
MDASQAITQLMSPEVPLRIEAAEYLGKHPEMVSSAIIPLCRAVVDEEEQVGQWATSALEDCGRPPVEERDALVELLTDRQDDVVYWAATLLGRLENDAQPVVPQLAQLATDHESANVRQRALWALGKIGDRSELVRTAIEDPIHQRNPRSARVAEQVRRQLFD